MATSRGSVSGNIGIRPAEQDVAAPYIGQVDVVVVLVGHDAVPCTRPCTGDPASAPTRSGSRPRWPQVGLQHRRPFSGKSARSRPGSTASSRSVAWSLHVEGYRSRRRHEPRRRCARAFSMRDLLAVAGQAPDRSRSACADLGAGSEWSSRSRGRPGRAPATAPGTRRRWRTPASASAVSLARWSSVRVQAVLTNALAAPTAADVSAPPTNRRTTVRDTGAFDTAFDAVVAGGGQR